MRAVARAVVRAAGAHVVEYGDDAPVRSSWLDLQFRALAPRLVRYFAPNVQAPVAGRVTAVPLRATHGAQAPVRSVRSAVPTSLHTVCVRVLQVPLGLNHNAWHLDRKRTRLQGGLLDPASGAVGRRQGQHEGRKPSLLCCCMGAKAHRAPILAQLEANGFVCDRSRKEGAQSRTRCAALPACMASAPCTRLKRLHRPSCALQEWNDTMTLYALHRFTLDVHGMGHNDFRIWEALLAGSVPVVPPSHTHAQRGDPGARCRAHGGCTPLHTAAASPPPAPPSHAPLHAFW